MKEEELIEGWEKRFERFDWSKFGPFAIGDIFETIKEILWEQNLKAQKETLERVRLQGVKANVLVSGEIMLSEHSMGYNQAVKDLEQLKKQILEGG